MTPSWRARICAINKVANICSGKKPNPQTEKQTNPKLSPVASAAAVRRYRKYRSAHCHLVAPGEIVPDRPGKVIHPCTNPHTCPRGLRSAASCSLLLHYVGLAAQAILVVCLREDVQHQQAAKTILDKMLSKVAIPAG